MAVGTQARKSADPGAARANSAREDLPPAKEPFGQALAEWLFSAYILLVFAGFLVFRSSATMVHGNEMSVERAVFTAVNAATLTGFQQNVSANDYLIGGQVMILVLTIGSSLFSLLVGSLAVVRILRLPVPDRRIVAAAIFAQVLALAVGGILLRGYGQSDLAAVAQAASAFGNSGVYLGWPPGIFDGQTHLILLPLAIAGGLGLTVLIELYDWVLRRRSLSAHARTVLGMTAAIYLLATATFFLLQIHGGDSFDWQRALIISSALSLNSRTLGMPLQPIHSYAPAMQWLIVLLMIIGASPGGTGGGLKTATVAGLFRGIRRSLAGTAAGRAFGLAAAWAACYAAIVLGAFLLILINSPDLPMPADRLLFLLVSAASNVGLSHEPVSLTRFPLDVLSFVMLVGRLVPLAILWWMATTTRDAELATA